MDCLVGDCAKTEKEGGNLSSIMISRYKIDFLSIRENIE